MRLLAGPDGQNRGRRQLEDVFENRSRCRHIAVAQHGIEGFRVDLLDEIRVRHQCAQLRPEQQLSFNYSIVERFYAEPVAYQGQCAGFPIENPEREHADEFLNGGRYSPLFATSQHHLGVGRAAKRMSQCFKFTA